MKTLWKYPLRITHEQVVEVPIGAKLRKFALDPENSICVWFEVDTEAVKTKVRLFIVGTGNELPNDATRYYGSVTRGNYVWHLYGV